MLSSHLDPAKILRALNTEPELRYVLIGGLAVATHGGTRLTNDVDLAVAFDVQNRGRLVRALAPLNPRPPRLAPGAGWIWDEISIRPPWSIFETDAGRLDLIVTLPGVDSFEGLFRRSGVVRQGDLEVRVASIDDLIAMKRVADRDRDRDDVNQLLEIQRGLRDRGEA